MGPGSVLTGRLLAALAALATRAEPPPQDGATGAPADAPAPRTTRFTWMREAFPGWRHRSGATGDYRLPEIVCGGAILLDADGDGDLDVFLPNGGERADLAPDAPAPGHALWRNDGGLRFVEVAAEAGVAGVPGSYGLGGVAADFDGDGDDDLYVCGWQRSFLYLNDGTGRFVERAEPLGVDLAGVFAVSAAALDADRDGRLDLYVATYVVYGLDAARRFPCESRAGVRDYCSPKGFLGVQDALFVQQQDGTFRDELAARGAAIPARLNENGKSLGVVAADVDGDGDPDLFVSNDGCANLLLLNDGAGRFIEEGVVRGCAYDENGLSRAGMGVDAGDADGDGDLDLVCVNLSFETNALFVNEGDGWFADECQKSGIAAADQGEVGFGVDLFDHDHDGDLDLLIANGEVLLHGGQARGAGEYEQSDQLLENDGTGRFSLVPPALAGDYFAARNAARGLATGDLDGDGDLDVVIVARDAPPVLLRNDHVETRRARLGQDAPADALLLDLRLAGGRRRAIGARVTATIAGKARVEEVRAGGSYASCHDPRLHFGAAGAAQADPVVVRWPDGTTQRFGPLRMGREWRLEQGREEPLALRELR